MFKKDDIDVDKKYQSLKKRNSFKFSLDIMIITTLDLYA